MKPETEIVEEEVDGTSAPDIFPHSHNFHVPFFITIIRNDDQPILSQAPSTKKQQPFTLNITYLLMALLALSYLNGCPIKKRQALTIEKKLHYCTREKNEPAPIILL